MWLPMPPRGLNRNRTNWGKEYREKMEYHTELDLRCPGYHIPRPPTEAIKQAEIRFRFYAKNPAHFMDPDNRTARIKYVLDWLRTRGYLSGDRDKNIVLKDQGSATFTGVEPDLTSLFVEIIPI